MSQRRICSDNCACSMHVINSTYIYLSLYDYLLILLGCQEIFVSFQLLVPLRENASETERGRGEGGEGERKGERGREKGR